MKFIIILLLTTDVHIKVTRNTDYGERYNLFVIEKNSFDENYSLKDYGINLVDVVWL